MLKLSQPKPILLEASECAVLLLHAYTSTVRDMRGLAEFLHRHGYTCYAIAYSGHGLDIDEFLNYTPVDWLQDSIKAYQHLLQRGYNQIAVIGVSLGAVLSLKLSEMLPISACIAMSTPQDRSTNDLFKRLELYANYLGQFQNNNTKQNSADLETKSSIQLQALQQLIRTTIQDTALISAPIFLLYGALDDVLYQSSAQTIYDHVNSTEKRIKNYPNTGHLMTLGQDQKQLFSDILDFLQQHHPLQAE
ncbi:MAG: Carboxylesterase [Acinetobacter bereziniae]|uniref:Carboxylesterase n=1 Tax=Acinetobacter bereziniae TaxID=106648 RepID=A0A833PA06_ACIBZ|nr:MAG: Carboxylesterase [Acinetobacter bereziniae]